MTLHGISLGEQPHEYIVPSETTAGKVWRVYTHLNPWKCTCPGHLKHHHCKHVEMVKAYLADMEGGREPEEEGNHGANMITPPPSAQNGTAPTLAIAFAWATFKDGRKFWDAGDATPNNVHAQVKAHFPRVALTRAKARVLRNALNIGIVSVEELEE